MSGRRREASDDSDAYSSDSAEPAAKKSKSSARQYSTNFNQGKETLSKKVAIATARVMIGLSNKNQVLNKNMVAKILEAENEKGGGLQFKKYILPELNKIFADVFQYEVVELPSKKSLHQQQDPESTEPQKLAPSDDYILLNNLPPSLRALNCTFLSEYTQPIGKSLKEMDNLKESTTATSIYGENLPRPTSTIVENGVTLLIICIIVLHDNNILQSDLLTILKAKFGLAFKEHESVSILGNQTLTDFLTSLHRQDYIDRTLVTSNDKSMGVRNLSSKNAKHDDNTLMIKLGRRCIVEWNKEEFIALFAQLMRDIWTEQLRQSAEFTVSSVWK